MSKLLYDRGIEDELMIQFIIMYAVNNADEPLSYQDLLNIVQGNCEISFTDFQIGLDNLIKTGHISMKNISKSLSTYSITQKGKYVIDFFYKQIPLIIREPIDKSIKDLYLDKRRNESVRASVEPINRKEFNAEFELFDDDRTRIMSLSLYAGAREQAQEMVTYFKDNATDVYSKILSIFNNASDEEKSDD